MILGLFAHVDAGKTTLSEALLYQSHASAHFGRVDHQNAFFDYEEQERKRGITIYTKEARFTWKDRDFTLIDTPGHIDFVAQAERVLPILDAAILIISATQGVQAHSETLWQLLKKHHIPTFLFVNKTDIAVVAKDQIMRELKEFFDDRCMDFSNENELWEEIAMSDDELLESYMKKGSFTQPEILSLIQQRRLFPCFFGSALKQTGIVELLDALCAYTKEPSYPEALSAYVYNVTYDNSGTRLTHVKITGGSIVNKQMLFDEKIDQIRCYHGSQYTCVNTVGAGNVCALCGLKKTKIKEVLNAQTEASPSFLSAALSYRLVPQGMDDAEMMKKLSWLIDEEPTLQLHYDQQLKEIRLQLYGDVQKEVLIERIRQRTQTIVSFEAGSVAYRETIFYPAEGVGHYEMLKHYAEVHLRLIPLKRDSGLKFNSTCPTSMIPAASQRMILHFLQSEALCGVICGSPLTDMEIVLLSGKVHEKHTAGSDLKEAAFRALKQGLCVGNCQLLEPTVRFRLTVPNQAFARAVYDLEQMKASWDPPSEKAGSIRISGNAPLSKIHNYSLMLRSYTKGEGSLSMSVIGYQTVDDQALVDQLSNQYVNEREQMSSSLFMIQGSPTYIPYDQVYLYADVKLRETIEDDSVRSHSVHRQIKIDENELKRVVAKLHQPRKEWHERTGTQEKKAVSKPSVVNKRKIPCLIVDGYNMIFSWPDLKETAQASIDAARSALISMLANYHGYQRGELIVVFDAYRTEAAKEHIVKDHTIYVVYTKQAQTADAYIEKTTHALSSDYEITVATSDREEQNVILAQGAMRMSANELYQKLQLQHRSAAKRMLQEPQFRNHALAELRKLNEQDRLDDE